MEQNAKLHPLLGIAAVSVIAVSLAGVGVLTGLLPSPWAATASALPPSVPSASTADRKSTRLNSSHT